jgi:tRNA A37 threonylcarbamoyladenosine dehydratase
MFVGDIMWLSRLRKIVSEENINKLKNTTVAIIGIGGVGGHALESITRIGIGNIVIVDKDVVDITNLNRQIIALNSNIGENKVDVAKKRILDINPECNVTTLKIFLDKSNIDELFKYNIDYVIDACDTTTTKILLIKECLKRNIKIISSMGTGNKFNPSMLEIIDIRKTSYDPLAKIIRKKLKDENINKKVMVVCSKEKPVKLNDRTPGSNSMVPSTAGILCASYVINDILK